MVAAKKRRRHMNQTADLHPLTATALDRLAATKRYWPHVQRKAGVSRSWITQFVSGKLKNPRVDRLQAIINACEEVLRGISVLEK